MSDLVRRSRRIVVLACAVVPVATPARALAQDPILDGHRFVPSTIVAWSFVDSEVSSTSDIGLTDFVLEPNVPPLASTAIGMRQFNGRFIEATQAVSGSVALTDFLSLNAQLSAGGILPRDTASALLVGGHGFIGETVGAALRLLRTDAFQLTLRGDFTAVEVESVIPALLPSSPRVTGHDLGVRPALAAALTLSPRFGLQGSFLVHWQDYDVEVHDDIVGVVGGLAATVSLDPVPLTVLVGANVIHEFDRDVFTPTANAVLGPTRTQWNVEGGLYMTLRSELDLGLVFRSDINGDHNNRFHGLFRLGYYF